MKTHDAENERTKRRYAVWLREAEGYSEVSIDQALAAIYRFEKCSKFRSLKRFHVERAIAFKKHLLAEKHTTTGKPLSKATLRGILAAIRKFIRWLAGQPGYRSRISYADAEYFKLSDKDTRIARATREKRVPTLEQIHHVLQTVPRHTEIERRNQAVLAFAILTGARDGAIASFRLKHLDMTARKVVQDAREVRTKSSKTFATWFFPVGDDIEQIVEEWIMYLEKEKLFGPEDPLFPATKVAHDEARHFTPIGLDRKPWSSAQTIRKIFRDSFCAAGLPPVNPHAFRDTIAQLGERVCRTPEEFKAWSQNLGHEKVLTTFTSYGTVAPARQGEIIRRLGVARTNDHGAEDLKAKVLAALEV